MRICCNFEANIYTLRFSDNNIEIQTENIETYRKAIKILRGKNASYYTYQTKDTKRYIKLP